MKEETKTQNNSVPESEENEQGKPGKGKKVFKTVVNTIINIMIVLVLVVSILIAVMALSSKANGGISVMFGHTVQNIMTDSMKGGSDDFDGGDLSKGDLIFGKPTENIFTYKYNVGDIVTFKTDDLDGDGVEDFLCHRIIEVYESEDGLRYRTKGDNNTVSDQLEGEYLKYIRANDIYSVFYTDDFNGEPYHGGVMKGFGNVIAFLQSKLGFFLVVLLPMIIFFLYELIRVILNFTNYKKAKAEDSKNEAVEAAVAAALAEKDKESESEKLSPEQMEQFKKFLEQQEKEKQKASEETENKE